MATQADEQAVDQTDLVDGEGVDRSLIRWLLSLTPNERLKYLDSDNRWLTSAKRLPNGTR